LPDVVEQARVRAVAAFSYENLAAAPVGWTSPEFEGRESKFDELVHAGSIHNRLRAFDWAREEIKPAESTGSKVGNQAGRSARNETVKRGANQFTGHARGSVALPDVVPATIAQPPSQAFGSDPSVWNLYPYVSNNPLTRTDPDGRTGLATLGATVGGGLVGGLWELGRQAIAGEDINLRKVAGSAARGAVVGAMMGSVIDTGGASLPVLMGAGVLSNVAGGEAERLVTGEQRTLEAVENDVAGGLVIGLTAGLIPARSPSFASGRSASLAAAARSTAPKNAGNLADDFAVSAARVTNRETVRWTEAVTPWSRRAFQRRDIDWQFVRPEGSSLAGKTNWEAAQAGWSPLRVNPQTGALERLNLHHVNKEPGGAIVETWTRPHSFRHAGDRLNARGLTNTKSDPLANWREDNPDWSRAWSNEQSAYWRWRTGRYNPPPGTGPTVPPGIDPSLP
jgi:hypothetical protein